MAVAVADESSYGHPVEMKNPFRMHPVQVTVPDTGPPARMTPSRVTAPLVRTTEFVVPEIRLWPTLRSATFATRPD